MKPFPPRDRNEAPRDQMAEGLLDNLTPLGGIAFGAGILRNHAVDGIKETACRYATRHLIGEEESGNPKRLAKAFRHALRYEVFRHGGLLLRIGFRWSGACVQQASKVRPRNRDAPVPEFMRDLE